MSLPTPIECPKSCDIYCTVVDAQIPNSYYTVDDRNNTITFTMKYGTLSTNVSYIVPPGNYTAATLATVFSNARVLNFTLGGAACSASLALAATTTSFLTLKVNSVTRTPAGAGASPSWSAIITNALLGFYSQSIAIGATVTGVAFPGLTNRFYLIGSTLNSLNQLPAQGFEAPVKVLCKVPLTASAGYTEQFLNPCAGSIKIANRVISEFDIFVLDDLGKNINFLGFDWSATLQFEYLPKIVDGPAGLLDRGRRTKDFRCI